MRRLLGEGLRGDAGRDLVTGRTLPLSLLLMGSTVRSGGSGLQLSLESVPHEPVVAPAPHPPAPRPAEPTRALTPTERAGKPSRRPPIPSEPWVSWAQLSTFLGGACKKRWLEARVAEGMPSAIIAGKRVFRISEVVPWLRDRGHIEEGAP